MSTARITHGPSTVTLGEVEERRWRLLAATTEDEYGNEIPDPQATIGSVTVERRARFAWLEDANTWLAEQEAQGWTIGEPVPSAAGYFGPTDAPGNCWTATATREEQT